MSTDPNEDIQPEDVERLKSRLVARIRDRLSQEERRLKDLEVDVARHSESQTASEATLRTGEAARQRQREEVRATWAVLQTLQRQFGDLENAEPGVP